MKKFTLLMALATTFVFSNAQNLALNKTATASTEARVAGLAVDGDGGTRWESLAEDPSWITIDLEQATAVGRIILKWEGAFGKAYDIQVSNDNATWTTIHSETNSNGGIDDFTVSGTGRFIRLYGTERGTPWGYSLWEFEVYGPTDAATDASLSDLTVNGTTVDGFSSSVLTYNIELPVGTTVVPTVAATPKQASPAKALVTPAAALPGTTSVVVTAQDGTTTETYTINFTVDRENVALNKVGTASMESQPANYAFDGNAGTRWETGAEDPQWIYVDLAGIYDVEGVWLSWEGAFGSAYTIDISMDAVNWTTVFTETNGDGGQDDISFAPAKGRYVRMHGTARGSIYGYSLWEFEVYGTLDQSTLVEDNSDVAISVYPNPATTTVNVKNNTTIELVEIYDLTGKCVAKKQVDANGTSLEIGHLDKGVYMIKTTVNGQSTISKFVKK